MPISSISVELFEGGSSRRIYSQVGASPLTVKDFYHSIQWTNTREAYRRQAGGLCERCYKKGIIKAGAEVHHKTRLTEQNVSDPSVSLAFDNLELLCTACHHAEHRKRKRYRVGENGEIDPPFDESEQG